MDLMMSAVIPRNTWPKATPNRVLPAACSARWDLNCCNTKMHCIRITKATNIAPNTCGIKVTVFCRKAAPSAICISTRAGLKIASDRLDGQP
jgi:hypothetical protein